MPAHDDAPSVRVEIEDETPKPVFAPAGATRPRQTRREQRSQRLSIGVGVVCLLLVGLAVAVLRPTDGENAAGEPRDDLTALRSGTNESDQQESEEVEAPEPLQATAKTIEELDDIRGIVAVNPGYLALGRGGGPGPAIYRSATGDRWERLPTTILNVDGDPLDLMVDAPTGFGALASFDGEYYLTMHQTAVDPVTRLPVSSIAYRLRSFDGVVWQVDPEFESLEGGAGWIVPFMNTDQATAISIVRSNSGNPLLERTLERFVIDEAIANGCWRRAIPTPNRADAIAALTPCVGNASVLLAADQLSQPDDAAQLALCLESLAWRSGPPLDVAMARRGRSTAQRYSGFGTSNALPVPTPGQGMAMLDPGRSLRGAPGCEPFEQETPEAPIDPGVLIVAPHEGSSWRSSNGSLPDGKLFWLGSPMVVTEREVLVPVERGVFALDRLTQQWEQRAEVISPGATIWIDPSGERLFTFGDGFFHVAATDGDWTRVDIDQAVDANSLLYVDESIAFFAANGGVVSIELPAIDAS